MAVQIPEAYRDLLGVDKRAFAHVATVMPDGTPQVTPVWVDFDGEYVLINSAKGRQKDLNMEHRPQIGIEISDPNNPYRYISIRGRVVEITEEGAVDHINKLQVKYHGKGPYPLPQGQVRRIYKILPERVQTQG